MRHLNLLLEVFFHKNLIKFFNNKSQLDYCPNRCYIIQVDKEKPDPELEIEFIKHFRHYLCFIIGFKLCI